MGDYEDYKMMLGASVLLSLTLGFSRYSLGIKEMLMGFGFGLIVLPLALIIIIGGIFGVPILLSVVCGWLGNSIVKLIKRLSIKIRNGKI